MNRKQKELAEVINVIQSSGRLVKVKYTEDVYDPKARYGHAHFKDESGHWFILEVNRYVDQSERGAVNNLLLNMALMKFFRDNDLDRNWNYPLTVQHVDQLLDDAVELSKWIKAGNAPDAFEGWSDTDDEKQKWVPYSVVRRCDTSDENYMLFPLGIVSTDDLINEIRRRIRN